MLNMLFGLKRQKSNSAVKRINNIAAVAKADGKVDRSERKIIYEAGKKQGLSEREINNVLNNKNNASVDTAAGNDEKFDYLYDLVKTMLADGDVDSREMDHCLAMANRLGFRPAIVGVLVRHISTGLKNGLGKEEIKKKAKAYM